MAEAKSGITRILIVDDHIVMREGISALLESQPDFRVVGEAGTVAQAISLAKELVPDLVLMDYGLPDGTGLEATRAIREVHPETKIVFLTVHESDDELFGAIRSGAEGYLHKNISASEMIRQLRNLARRETAISDDFVDRIVKEFARSPKPARDSVFDELTEREREVLRELSHGASNQDIADRLFISVNTVRNHVHSILQKLDVANRHQAARLAAERGFI